MARQGKDVPGNAMASALAVQRQMLAVAERLYRAERIFDGLFEQDVDIRSFSVRCPTLDKPGYMIVVRAWVEGQAMVAFHDAPEFAEAVSGVLARLENRSLKFKEDQYAK